MEHMNGLALYAGYGGLDLGVQIAEPWYKTVCHVEREASCAANLVARMEAQELHQAPVWDDSATFDGYPWRGKVDIITAGFPCPEVSVAGKRKGVNGERWLWDDVARIIGETRARKIFLENVRGLTSVNHGYAMRSVLGDLAQMRYDAVWASVPAASVGARQKRDRIFIVARARCEDGKGRGQRALPSGRQNTYRYAGLGSGIVGLTPGNVGRGQFKPQGAGSGGPGPAGTSGIVGSVYSQRCGEARQCQGNGVDWYGGGLPTAPPGPDSEQLWFELLRDIETTPQPAVCGVADGNSKRMDRLRMLGNGVYPLAAAYAWRVGNAVLATQFGGE